MNTAVVKRSVTSFRSLLWNTARVVTVVGTLAAPFATAAQPAGHAAQERNGASALAGRQHGDDTKGKNETMVALPTTGNPDVDFAQAMRVHHQGAIDMAETELKNGKDTSMRKLARDVLNAHRKQIVRIDRFLAKHGPQAKKS